MEDAMASLPCGVVGFCIKEEREDFGMDYKHGLILLISMIWYQKTKH